MLIALKHGTAIYIDTFAAVLGTAVRRSVGDKTLDHVDDRRVDGVQYRVWRRRCHQCSIS